MTETVGSYIKASDSYSGSAEIESQLWRSTIPTRLSVCQFQASAGIVP
jgi:hypothetical protein